MRERGQECITIRKHRSDGCQTGGLKVNNTQVGQNRLGENNSGNNQNRTGNNGSEGIRKYVTENEPPVAGAESPRCQYILLPLETIELCSYPACNTDPAGKDKCEQQG